MKYLSPTMQSVLNCIKACPGKTITRWPGGSWYCSDHAGGTDRFGTQTIHAMVARGVLVWTDWRENSCGRFPVAARISKDIL